MSFKLFSKAALAGIAIMAASTVSAATYTIDNVVNGSVPGFTYSLFHKATGCGGMCGSTIANVTGDAADVSGTWDSVSGAIDIAFQVIRTVAGGGVATVDVTGSGNVLGSAGGTGIVTFEFWEEGLAGATAATIDGLNSAMITFADTSHSGPANSFDGSSLWLWGGNSADTSTSTKIGTDLSISLSPVPVPAAGLLLLGALGGLGLARRRRKAA